MRSRFMRELNTPEIQAFLKAAPRTAFLPVGSLEMHGPHQPVGTDTLIAKAAALLLAEAADGLVLPELDYTWAGATDGFAGTVSVEPELVLQTLRAVAPRVFRMGFARLVTVSAHYPNEPLLFFFVRRFFEEHHRPVVCVNPMFARTEEAKALFAGQWEQSEEASVVLASMQILGLGQLYTEKEMAYDDAMPPFPDSQRAIGKVGTVGYFFQDPRQHACPSRFVSLQRGLDFMKLQAKTIAAGLDAAIDEYARTAADQKNQGWFTPEGP